jgi:lipid II:glycine glycyltransferase (peptidoglycan interpeptide bridge formation enzyme)
VKDHTHVIDLRTIGIGDSGWTCSELPHKARGQMRSSLRKARDAGVTVAEETSLDHWREYFALYESSQSRWGRTLGQPHAWRLFQILHGQRSPNIKLWLARMGESAVAGAICFYNNKHVVYWHGASSGLHAQFRPVNLLLAHLIGDAHRRGFWWFDFNPSGGLEGVEKFKESFGAKMLVADMLICKNLPRRLLDTVKRVRSI